MGKFAPVCSLAHLKYLSEVQNEDYHLLLAHKVLEAPDKWGEFFQSLRQKYDPFIIMDNSLVEMGRPLEPELVAQAAAAVKANAIVLPDMLKDMPRTIALSLDAVTKLQDSLLAKSCGYMGVIQGKSEDECMECAMTLVKFAKCKYLAVPRCMVSVLGSRIFLTRRLWETFGIPIHLLGFSGDLSDDIASTVCCNGVIGIDSAKPLWLGQVYDRELHTLPSVSPGKRPLGWLENDCPLTNKALSNVLTMRSLLGVTQAGQYVQLAAA